MWVKCDGKRETSSPRGKAASQNSAPGGSEHVNTHSLTGLENVALRGTYPDYIQR